MKKLSENELGEKIDRCMADTVLKLSGGIALGIVASVALFRGRTFPIWFGSGFGLGMGWSNFRHDLQSPYLLYGKKVKTEDVETVTQPKPEYTIIMDPRLQGSS